MYYLLFLSNFFPSLESYFVSVNQLVSHWPKMESMSRLTSNQADHKHLSDPWVCVFIKLVLLYGAQLPIPDVNLQYVYSHVARLISAVSRSPV